MVEPRFPCRRCGQPQRAVDVTQFGDRERRFVQAEDCDCPGPRCFACHARLDDRQHCPTLGCYMLDRIVPIPEIA